MTLDDIKVSIRHDDECASIEGADGWEGTAPECNCTRRDKIALLERLQSPNVDMVLAGEAARDDEQDSQDIWKAMLAAAEEAK